LTAGAKRILPIVAASPRLIGPGIGSIQLKTIVEFVFVRARAPRADCFWPAIF
jgi:hypothetical protein